MERGCDFLIMDDGFQSAQIHMDYALVVVDGALRHRQRPCPAGRTAARRADRPGALRDRHRAHGRGQGGRGGGQAGGARGHARSSRRGPGPRGADKFANRRFLAFAGIGHPDKFFDTVTQAGGTVVMSRSFPDHHFYSNDELKELVADGRRGGAGADHDGQGFCAAAQRHRAAGSARQAQCARDRRGVRERACGEAHHRGNAGRLAGPRGLKPRPD